MTIGVLTFRHLTIPFTEQDKLWAARMLVGEEGKNATYDGARSVLSTMIRRLAFTQVTQQPPLMFPSLTVLLVGRVKSDGSVQKGYSQPVSIYWRTRGTDQQQRHRRYISGLSWAQIPTTIQRVTVDVLSGKTPLSEQGTGAVHFAAPFLVEKRLHQYDNSKRVHSPAKNHLMTAYGGRQSYEEPTMTAGAGAVSARAGGLWVPAMLVTLVALVAWAREEKSS